MEIDILEKKDNPLLKRTEIIADVSFEAVTPSREQIKQEVSKKLKANPEFVIVRNIYPFFGDMKAEVVVHIYQKKEDVEKIESRVYTQRMAGKDKGEKKEEGKEEEKKEEKASEKKEEKPEEKKEEKPKEAKKEEKAEKKEEPAKEKKEEAKKEEKAEKKPEEEKK